MKRNKGFTLIELIAIISILGLLALIAVPVVNNVVKESKIKANKIACQNYINAVQQYIVESQMNGKPIKNGVYDLSYFADKIEMNYQNEFEGTIVISKSNINDYTIKKEDQTFAYQDNKITYVDEKEIKYSQMKNQSSVRISDTESESQYEWEMEYRSLIKNIYFRNITIPEELVFKKYLLSVSSDDPIYAYLIINNDKYIDSDGNKLDMYDLYITSENIIKLPKNSRAMFRKYSNLVTINFQNIDTSEVTDMGWFLGSDPKLEHANVEVLDTENVIKLDQFFNGDSSLKELNVTTWDTRKNTRLDWTFSGIRSIKVLDLRNLDTSQVTNVSGMFWYENNLTVLGLEKFDFSKVTSFKYFSANLMIEGDTLDLTKWKVSKSATILYSAFNNIQVKELDISNWDISNVTDMTTMFSGSTKLEKIYVGDGWDTSKVTVSTNMFKNCTKLPNFDSTKLDVTMATTSKYLTKK